MRSARQYARLVVVAVVLLTAVGCGSNKVYPVKGMVKFEGQPLKGGGSISFVPLGKKEGKTAGGEIAQDGTYTLMTHKTGDGSMTGEFRVVITQVTEREPENTGDGEKRVGKPIEVVAKADRIPDIYADHYNSPLRATVEAKENAIDFDLKRNPGAAQGAVRDGRRRDDTARLDRNPFALTFAELR
jgi:hypothetical protein